MENYPHPSGPISRALRKLGSIFIAKPRTPGLLDYSADRSSRPARLVVDTTDPPRFCPHELPANAQEVLDREFAYYWNEAVEGQARRARQQQP